jgi:hypothetical protein
MTILLSSYLSIILVHSDKHKYRAEAHQIKSTITPSVISSYFRKCFCLTHPVKRSPVKGRKRYFNLFHCTPSWLKRYIQLVIRRIHPIPRCSTLRNQFRFRNQFHPIPGTRSSFNITDLLVTDRVPSNFKNSFRFRNSLPPSPSCILLWLKISLWDT